MFLIHDVSDYNTVWPMELPDDDWSVSHEYSGNDTLKFEVGASSSFYGFLQEEVKIDFVGGRYGDSRFIVKTIDEQSDFVVVNCNIDLDDWKQTIFSKFYKSYSTLSGVLDLIIPDGWTYTGASAFSKIGTIGGDDTGKLLAVTPLEVLDACQEEYECVFNFDVVNCVLTVVDPESFEASGDFFSDELNLSSVGFTGSTKDFATRLYAYGKRDDDGENPVTFADINDGKEYIDSNEYAEKVVCVGWSDERYEVPENLLADAKKKLAELAVPERSYSCDVNSFGEGAWLYKVVTLIDRKRKTRIDHQIVTWVERANAVDDTCVLSAYGPSVTSSINDKIKSLQEDNSKLSQQISDEHALTLKINQNLLDAIDTATQKIAGSYGGYFKWIYDTNGNPMELVNLADSEDINTAKQVWRWNKEGLGHSNNGYAGPYDLAILADGSINASMVTFGVLNANLMRAGIISDVDGNNLFNLETGEVSWSAYSTTEEMNSAIEVSAESITVSVEGAKIHWCNCTTASATQTKVCTHASFVKYVGAAVCVKFSYANTASSPKLTVQNATSGATETATGYIYVNNVAMTSDYYWKAQDTITLVWDGTYWRVSDGYTRSAIEVLRDSITLSVTSGTGGKASIVLSVDGEKQTASTDVVTSARTAFANESTAITISAGTITFNSNTFVVNSTYFKVTSTGVITASSGTIGGFTISSSSIYKTKTSLTDNTYGLYLGTDGLSVGSGTAYTAIAGGYLRGGTSSDITGYVGFNNYWTSSGIYGTRLAGRGCICLLTNGGFGIGSYYSFGTSATITTGQSGSVQVVTYISSNWTPASGSATWNYKTITFTKGLMTTSL